jgi:hypothetical protein
VDDAIADWGDAIDAADATPAVASVGTLAGASRDGDATGARGVAAACGDANVPAAGALFAGVAAGFFVSRFFTPATPVSTCHSAWARSSLANCASSACNSFLTARL